MRLRHAVAAVLLLLCALPASAGLPPLHSTFEIIRAAQNGLIPAVAAECTTLDVLTYDSTTNLWSCSSVAASTATAGAGLLNTSGTWSTDSTEADFLASGALTCGASTQGKMKVHTTALQYCDNTATPVLRYAAYAGSTGVATSATALAANGANCAAGTHPLGVDASGAAESCTNDYSSAVQTYTVADSGNGSAATSTLTPTAKVVKLTCSDADGCTITMGEGSAAEGDEVRIINISANAATFADTSGLSELTGAVVLGQRDTLTLVYLDSTWNEVSASNN